MKNSEFRDYFNRLSETLNHMDTDAIERLADLLIRAREREVHDFYFWQRRKRGNSLPCDGRFSEGHFISDG